MKHWIISLFLGAGALAQSPSAQAEAEDLPQRKVVARRIAGQLDPQFTARNYTHTSLQDIEARDAASDRNRDRLGRKIDWQKHTITDLLKLEKFLSNGEAAADNSPELRAPAEETPSDELDTLIQTKDQTAMGLSKLSPSERRHLGAWLVQALAEANARNRADANRTRQRCARSAR